MSIPDTTTCPEKTNFAELLRIVTYSNPAGVVSPSRLRDQSPKQLPQAINPGMSGVAQTWVRLAPKVGEIGPKSR